MGRALQHPTPPLLLRQPKPHHLREPHRHRYDEPSGITITPCVQDPGLRPDLTKHLGGHQLCCAHLLRDLTDAAETYPDAHWPPQAIRALRGLIHASNTARDNGLTAVPEPLAAPLRHEFRHAVRAGLSEIPRVPGPASKTKQHPGRLLLECLRDREPDVLRFTTDTRIWPTNNQSERDLRPLKTQQKISGRLQCEDTTRDRLTIRSYITTATRNGTRALTALRDTITGAPWTPTPA